MRRATLLLACLLTLQVACGPDTPQGDPDRPAWSGSSDGAEAPDGLPDRADCAGAKGLIQLGLPTPGEDAELTVFALSPEGLDSQGVPAAPPVADVVVPIDPLQQGGPFPVSYRICAPGGPHILLGALDAQGDGEVLGEGDYIGRTEVTIPALGTVEANILLDQVLTAGQGKKGDKPKDQSRRQRR